VTRRIKIIIERKANQDEKIRQSAVNLLWNRLRPEASLVGKARSCNFPTDATNFRQNFDTQLQIYVGEIIKCSKFYICSQISSEIWF